MSDTWKRFMEMQAAIPHIPKDSEADAGKYRYRYISLGAILEVVQPIVRDHGFVLRGTTSPGVVRYEILDAESAGVGTISYAEVEIPTGTTDMQRLGSAITYARRYALTVLLDIAADDDDGRAASKPMMQTRKPRGPSNKQIVFDHVKQSKERAAEVWTQLETEFDDPSDLDPATLLEWLAVVE